MSSSLKKIVFTRPDFIFEQFSELFSRMDWQVLHLPLLEIQTLHNEEVFRKLESRLQEFDTFIFISKNAVKHACELLPRLRQNLHKPSLAIGPATAEVLGEAGFSNVFFAPAGGGSEELLEQAILQAERVKNQRVLIFRGHGGRELLAQQLRARGADVEYVELYIRGRPQRLAEDIEKTWQKEVPAAMVISSAEALQNLLESAPLTIRDRILLTPLVVLSERIKNIAKSLGFCAAIKVAIGYSDEECMMALKEMFEVDKQ